MRKFFKPKHQHFWVRDRDDHQILYCLNDCGEDYNIVALKEGYTGGGFINYYPSPVILINEPHRNKYQDAIEALEELEGYQYEMASMKTEFEKGEVSGLRWAISYLKKEQR